MIPQAVLQPSAPTSMVRMQDGRLVSVYGYRLPPYGVRAAVSEGPNVWNSAARKSG